MKVVVLAGGFGTRLSEETAVMPKPMVEIGDRPILWHIMRIYLAHGLEDFVICCGYKASVIKDFFANYTVRQSDITFDMRTGETTVHHQGVEPWQVSLVDTGDQTMTGGRLKRVREYVGDETFCMTYGDGVSDVNIQDLLAFHRSNGVLATLTAVQPPGRFGAFALEPDQTLVDHFREKPRGDHDGAWINGGFFVLEPEVFDYIDDDSTVWEAEPLRRLAHEGKLAAYRHDGFWQPMDTLRDKMVLEQLWDSDDPPWKIW
jgi:glucose-1-phosphate cytidylyltransferase